MQSERQPSHRHSERGVALLIAIFVLLLVSVVAIALLVSSGTETALGSNYRSSSTVYYAALAGLEEARGRLLSKNANYFGSSVVSPTTTFPLGQPLYVINALPSETVVPWDPGNPYYDKEYFNEFGQQASAASHQAPQNSVWNNNAQGIPGPVYKWVRITAATELSLNLDVNSDGTLDHITPIYYCPSLLNSQSNPAPSLIVPTSTTCPSSALQVLQITAFAYLPNGSQKYLQYVVVPVGQNNLTFPAALTLNGPNVGQAPAIFSLPYGSGFYVSGNDTSFYSNATGCVSGTNSSPNPVRAIGYTYQDNSQSNIAAATGGNRGEYVGVQNLGTGSNEPDVYYVGNPPAPGQTAQLTIAANMQTVAQLNSLVSTISQEADVTLTGPLTQSDSNNLMPSAMSASNPMTVVVNGDFTESGWSGTGYGILLVTGTFTYDPNSSWNGIILVIGNGIFNAAGASSTQINGAVFIAATTGSPPPSLATPTFNFASDTYGNLGIYYSSCWVQYVQSPSRYQALSFKEIPVP
jgi:hypothetical protein